MRARQQRIKENGVQIEERGAPRCVIDSRGGKMKFRTEGEEGESRNASSPGAIPVFLAES